MAAMDMDSGLSKPTATTEADDEADPIVASYDIYTNPNLPANRRLLLLQHPNKQGPKRILYPEVKEVRLKKESGMVEVDVPMNLSHADYDRDKGLRWGSALSRSLAAKNGGTHGLAGGFGTRGTGAGAGAGAGARGPKAVEPERELSILDWNEAMRQDKVLRIQTLGGQYPIENETSCRWMVGIFKEGQLHLTPATSLIDLRPQLHHLDAHAEQERLSRPREGGSGPAAGAGEGSKEGAAAATASSSGGPQGGPAAAAKAIHMSIKSAGAGDSGELTVDTMVDRIRKVQVEPWARLAYEHDASQRAWDVFHDNLVYERAAADVKADDVKGKGKGKQEKKTAAADEDDEETGDGDGDGDGDVRKYKARWAEDEFLKAVSNTSAERPAYAFQGDDELQIKAEVTDMAAAAPAASAEPAKRGAGAARGRGGRATAAPAPRRGAKGKSVAFKES